MSPLLISMVPFNNILKRSIGGNLFTKSQVKINLFMYMDDIKHLVKKRKMDTLI